MTTTASIRNAGRGPGSGQTGLGQVWPTAHLCPVGSCHVSVPTDRLMCRAHWYQVPKPLREAVWATWRCGAGEGSLSHAAAIRAAVNAVDHADHR